jgi:predicted anti-sigma-YlaC factor YlaD
LKLIDHLCRGVRPWFSDLLDGEPVPPFIRVQAALHLTFCPMCRRFHRSLEQTKQGLQALKDAPPPPMETKK